jgi:hypothetical protein
MVQDSVMVRVTLKVVVSVAAWAPAPPRTTAAIKAWLKRLFLFPTVTNLRMTDQKVN